MNNKKESWIERGAMYFSVSILAMTTLLIIYSITRASLGSSGEPVFVLFLILLTMCGSILILKSPAAFPAKRGFNFAVLIGYYSLICSFGSWAFIGGTLTVLEKFSSTKNWNLATLLAVFLLVVLTFLLPLKLNWGNMQFLKDSKAAIYIVNAVMIVIFELKTISPAFLESKNEELHLYILPTLISSLIALSILEYKVVSPRKSKRRYKVSKMSN